MSSQNDFNEAVMEALTLLRQYVDNLDERTELLNKMIGDLAKNSHPPILYVTCNMCYATVKENVWEYHRDWHTNILS